LVVQKDYALDCGCIHGNGIDVELMPEDYTSKKARYAESDIRTAEYTEGYMCVERLGRRSMQA